MMDQPSLEGVFESFTKEEGQRQLANRILEVMQ
jgi:hypothetical protein